MEGQGLVNDGFWFEDHVDDKGAGKSVYDFFHSKFPYRDWHERIANGKVLRNGVVVMDESVVCVKGDVLRSFRDPWVEPDVDTSLEVAKETDEIVVVVKRKGNPVVPHGNFLQSSLVHIVQKKYPGAAPLHRLGRGTTGAIAFAKTAEAARKYCRLFAERNVKKVYRCVVSGVVAWDHMEAQCYIGPVQYEGCAGGVFACVPDPVGGDQQQRKKNDRKNAAKKAITHFHVVRRGDNWSVLDADILTGRPHQIRIMTGFVGYPLVGDPLYGVGGVPLANGIIYDEDGHDRPSVPGDTGYLLHSMLLKMEGLEVRVAPPNRDEWKPYFDDW